MMVVKPVGLKFAGRYIWNQKIPDNEWLSNTENATKDRALIQLTTSSRVPMIRRLVLEETVIFTRFWA